MTARLSVHTITTAKVIAKERIVDLTNPDQHVLRREEEIGAKTRKI